MNVDGRLKDKVAVVTGAASGIGEAIAIVFAQAGARVILIDRDEKKGRLVEQRINAEPAEGHFIRADLEIGQQIATLVSDAVARFGGLDVLVNCAALHGSFNKKSVVDTPNEEWDRTLAVNLTAPFLLSKYSIPHMLKRGGGSIINISSIGGLEAFPEFAAYSTSKGGLIQLTKSMAIDFGPGGIRVNAICPGAIDTPGNAPFIKDPDEYLKMVTSVTALKSIGKPEDVAYAALYLASDESRYVTGISLIVDGGRMVFA